MRNVLLIWLLFFCVLLLHGCGGGGGGGETTPAPPPSSLNDEAVNGDPPPGDPPPTTPFASPTGWKMTEVSTDGVSTIVATGSTIGDEGGNAVVLAFDASGAIRWQKNNSPGMYRKSGEIVNGSLHAVRTAWVDNKSQAYLEKVNLATEAVTATVVAGQVPDTWGTTAGCGNFAADTINQKLYVAAGDGTEGKMSFSKVNLGDLGNKTPMFTYDASCLQDMGMSEAGNFFYSISGNSIDAYTLEGVYFDQQDAPAGAQQQRTVANSDKLYVSGSQAGQAYVWVYGLNASLLNSFPVGVGQAEGMTFGPNGELYVAISSGVGPVRLDPATGTIAWTGDSPGNSVAYMNGKVYLATGGDTIKVLDSSNGARL